MLISQCFKKDEKEIKMAKYIFVTGGVVSGLGKGITAASPKISWLICPLEIWQ